MDNDEFGSSVYLITGVTTFVGKAVLERLLRSGGDRKIYVTLSSSPTVSIMQRLEHLLNDDLFASFRNAGSEGLQRIVPILDDILLQSKDGVPLSETCLRMLSEVQVVVNCMSLPETDLKLRDGFLFYTARTLHLASLVRNSRQLRAFVQLSTAYVNSDRTGVIAERLPELPGIDPEALYDHVCKMSPEKCEHLTRRIVGPYASIWSFIKAVTERLLVPRVSVPLLLIRPSIIGAMIRDPQPGWIDSVSPFGAMVLYAGLGLVQAMYCKGSLVIDIVPVDFVVHGIFASISAVLQRKYRESLLIMHVGTSSRNPVTWEFCRQVCVYYWQSHVPQRALDTPNFYFYTNALLYRLWFFTKYDVPGAVYSTYAKILSTESNVERAQRVTRAADAVRSTSSAFRNFVDREWIFDTSTYETLCSFSPGSCNSITSIDWRSYLSYFCYGLHRHVLGEEGVQPPNDILLRSLIHRGAAEEARRPWYRRAISDIMWAYSGYRHVSSTQVMRTVGEMKAIVIGAPRVQNAIEDLVKGKVKYNRKPKSSSASGGSSSTPSREELLDYADAIVERMSHSFNISVVRVLGWFMRKIFRTIYTGIHVDEKGIAEMKRMSERGRIVMMPTHRSYVDFLIVSYMCFEYSVSLPHIAAGEDFLAIMIVNWLFRNAGAFFIRRSFKDDPLYWAIFAQYLQQLLEDRCPTEFFLEGTRSRSGKSLPPKLGMLGVIVDTYVERTLNTRDEGDIFLFPISISYEKVLEAELYSNEMLGEKKPKESLGGLFRARQILKLDFGRINVQFSSPISLAKFVKDKEASHNSVSLQQPFDELHNSEHRRSLVKDLAYHIIGRLNATLVITPTAIVSALLLMCRRGTSFRALISQASWLRDDITSRGATVAFEGPPAELVQYTFELMANLVEFTRGDMVRPLTTGEQGHRTLLVLGVYRNQLMHLYFEQGMLALVLSCFGPLVAEQFLIGESVFLYELLCFEFVTDPPKLNEWHARRALARLLSGGIIEKRGDDGYGIARSGETMITFLCHLFWPFIESYWIAAVTLVSLRPNRSLDRTYLRKRMSWLGEERFREGKGAFFESCSMELLGNAIALYQSIDIIRKKEQPRSDVSAIIGRTDDICLSDDGTRLERLIERIGKLRHSSAVEQLNPVAQSMAEFPTLASRL